jgi:hypothetical protein
MKNFFIGTLLIMSTSPCFAQSEVFLCVDETGKKSTKALE